MNKNFTSENTVLKLKDIMPGIFARLPKIITFVKTLKKTLNTKPTDKKSLGLIIEQNAVKYPDKNSILYEDRKYTHKETNEEVNRYANYFLSIGMKKGEVGLMLFKIDEKVPFKGYTSEEDTNKKIIKDVFEKGDIWFNTGDLMRDIGFKHAQFVDRLGDTFRWKGENVSTAEVEDIIDSIDNIENSSVYGVEITNTEGRAGMASIVLSKKTNESIVMKKLAFKLKKSLPSYAIPIFVRITKGLETTHTFKIKKTDLKKIGFDINKTDDPIYIMLPGSDEYVYMTKEIYENVMPL